MRALFNMVMRIVSTLLGLLMLAMGSVWMMQGLGVGPAESCEASWSAICTGRPMAQSWRWWASGR